MPCWLSELTNLWTTLPVFTPDVIPTLGDSDVY